MTKITQSELIQAAQRVGLAIQHDCGGYRIVKETDSGGQRYVFPDSGVCPTESKRACLAYLKGVAYGESGINAAIALLKHEENLTRKYHEQV